MTCKKMQGSNFKSLTFFAIAYKANCVSKYHLMGIKRSRVYQKALKEYTPDLFRVAILLYCVVKRD